jgi:HNH endonuclease
MPRWRLRRRFAEGRRTVLLGALTLHCCCDSDSRPLLRQNHVMDEPTVPASSQLLGERLRRLKEERNERQAQRRAAPVRRQALSKAQRAEILAKTDSRCHICGGGVVQKWQADHVLAHSGGGAHSVDNYLAAHALCNNYRWDYSAEEFQWILKIGVWARSRMEGRSTFGQELLKRFYEYERRRAGRRVRATPTQSANDA